MAPALPILLFDLNGTLIHRNKEQRTVLFRPYLDWLPKLRGFFRMGIFSSMIEPNVRRIVEQIEAVVGEPFFDRELMFSRQHTIQFTRKERDLYRLSFHKRKKRLSQLFGPEQLEHVFLVDDELVRVVEKHRTLSVTTWDGNMDDTELRTLYHRLVAWACPQTTGKE